jgi:hypothetical protein
MVEWCQIVFTNMTNGKIFVYKTEAVVNQEGRTLYNEEWCFVQGGIGQQIKVMFVNHRSTYGDEGIAWRSSNKTFYNWNHIEKHYGCKVLMAYNVQKCQWLLQIVWCVLTH